MASDEYRTLWLSPLGQDRDFLVHFRDDHLHIHLGKDFKGVPEHRQELWDIVRDECEKHGTRRVLVEGYMSSGERDPADVIDAGQRTVPNLWLAFALSNYQPSYEAELYVAIAASKGVRVKFFSNADHALMWLRANSPA
jgi:hypothetical protein